MCRTAHVFSFVGGSRVAAKRCRCISSFTSQEPHDAYFRDIRYRLFAIIVAMHRGVTRRADAKLREQFDAQGTAGEVSRRLMRASGYNV
jgi:hypothetical protein